jgi:hypothetical protein
MGTIVLPTLEPPYAGRIGNRLALWMMQIETHLNFLSLHQHSAEVQTQLKIERHLISILRVLMIGLVLLLVLGLASLLLR